MFNSYAYTEPQAAVTEDIDRGRLLRHQHGLPLGQDDDAGADQADRLTVARDPRGFRP